MNFRPLKFKLKAKTDIKTLSDPITVKGITLSNRGHRHFESSLTFFNSKERVELPLTAAWWGDFETKDKSENGKKAYESATFEIILEPTCADGDFFYIHGKRFVLRVNQMKVQPPKHELSPFHVTESGRFGFIRGNSRP